MSVGNKTINEWLNYQLLTIGDTQITLASFIMFIIVILLTLLALSINRYFFSKLQKRSGDEHTASIYVLQRLSRYLLIAIGLFAALSSLGIDMTHIALLATALSVGLGFGLQSIFNNFFSGIIILSERSLKVGDFIELDGGIAGTVQEINIRSTLVRTRNNIDILVPNSEFVNGRVTNWTLNDPTFRLQIPFGVAYGSDKNLVKKAALEAAKRLPYTLYAIGKEPDVWLTAFGDNSLNFELVVWVNPKKNTKPGGMRAGYTWELDSSLKQYNIEIPFPQRDIHIKSMPDNKI